MEITDVEVKLDTNEDCKVLAYCDITIEGVFIVHDIKVLMGDKGVFIDMPSRRHKLPCWHCKEKVDCGSKHCTCCGAPTPHVREQEPAKRFHAVAHPISNECREQIVTAVISAYEKALNEPH